MFIVHMEVAGLPSMEFLMHDYGLHYYEPPKKDLLFLNPVSKMSKVLARYKSIAL